MSYIEIEAYLTKSLFVTCCCCSVEAETSQYPDPDLRTLLFVLVGIRIVGHGGCQDMKWLVTSERKVRLVTHGTLHLLYTT